MATDAGAGAVAGARVSRHGWIRDALKEALVMYQAAPLDVILVHYGREVPAEWQATLSEAEAAQADA